MDTVKDSKTFGGIYKPPEDIFVDKADRAGITYHLNSYGIVVEFVSQVMFMITVPLNMSDAKFIEAVSLSPVPFEAFSLPKEKKNG